MSCSRRNNVKKALRKNIQQLINEQANRDRLSMKSQIHDEIVQKLRKNPYILIAYLPQKVLFVSQSKTKIP